MVMPSASAVSTIVSISHAGSTTTHSCATGSPTKYTKFCIGPSSICFRYSSSLTASIVLQPLEPRYNPDRLNTHSFWREAHDHCTHGRRTPGQLSAGDPLGLRLRPDARRARDAL